MALQVEVDKREIASILVDLHKLEDEVARDMPKSILDLSERIFSDTFTRRAPERTKPHRIPKKGYKFMMWEDEEGFLHIAKKVNHPGGPYRWRMNIEREDLERRIYIHLPFKFYGKHLERNWVSRSIDQALARILKRFGFRE